MKSLLTRFAALALLLAIALPFPEDASAYSYHPAQQAQNVYSDNYSVTAVYDPYGYEIFNTYWLYGSYNYTFAHPAAFVTYSHWVYDYYAGRWVEMMATRLENYN